LNNFQRSLGFDFILGGVTWRRVLGSDGGEVKPNNLYPSGSIVIAMHDPTSYGRNEQDMESFPSRLPTGHCERNMTAKSVLVLEDPETRVSQRPIEVASVQLASKTGHSKLNHRDVWGGRGAKAADQTAPSAIATIVECRGAVLPGSDGTKPKKV
jgi:hypothetical protein